MTIETVLMDDQRDKFVGDLVDYGTDFVAPLYAVVDSIEQAVLQFLEIVAWRYKTPTGWHATTDAARALAIKDHHDVEPLFAKRAAPITKES